MQHRLIGKVLLGIWVAFLLSSCSPFSKLQKRGNDDAKYMQLKVGRVFRFRTQSLEPSLNAFNAFNTGANTQWGTDANLVPST